jgi:AcrR family transcriptional regulator
LDSEDIENPTGVDPRLAGIFAYNGQRKQSSRDSLLAAATDLFCSKGYARVSVEDIATQAGVSRVTFYRHFPTKAAVALELFQRAAEVAAPRMLAIAAQDFRDRATVMAWLTDFFELNREMQGILRVLSQANVEEADFSQQVRPYIGEIIAALGSSIPAFDVDPEAPSDQRRWVRAWLLIYTLLDQSNHAATVGGISTNPMMLEVLADQFLDFVRAEQSSR